MAVAGGAVPTLRLELQYYANRLKVSSNGSMGRGAVLEDASEICDRLQEGRVVYVNATGNRLDLVQTELHRRNVWVELWQW
jgi:hypothetical protein